MSSFARTESLQLISNCDQSPPLAIYMSIATAFHIFVSREKVPMWSYKVKRQDSERKSHDKFPSHWLPAELCRPVEDRLMFVALERQTDKQGNSRSWDDAWWGVTESVIFSGGTPTFHPLMVGTKWLRVQWVVETKWSRALHQAPMNFGVPAFLFLMVPTPDLRTQL